MVVLKQFNRRQNIKNIVKRNHSNCTVGEWLENDSPYSDEVCPGLGTFDEAFEACKVKCLGTHMCNAFNFVQNTEGGGCNLR